MKILLSYGMTNRRFSLDLRHTKKNPSSHEFLFLTLTINLCHAVSVLLNGAKVNGSSA